MYEADSLSSVYTQMRIKNLESMMYLVCDTLDSMRPVGKVAPLLPMLAASSVAFPSVVPIIVFGLVFYFLYNFFISLLKDIDGFEGAQCDIAIEAIKLDFPKGEHESVPTSTPESVPTSTPESVPNGTPNSNSEIRSK